MMDELEPNIDSYVEILMYQLETMEARGDQPDETKRLAMMILNMVGL